MHLAQTIKTFLFAAAVAFPSSGGAKTLVVGIPINLTGLDPAGVNNTLSQSALRTIYQGLIGFDTLMKPIPLLAESYETNDDATEFTFHLRRGVVFHDETPFDAEAAKINIERLADPANKLSRHNLASMIKRVEVLDPYTLRIVLDNPFGALPNALAHPGAAMISPAALQKYGKDVDHHPTGTGPFRFVSWTGDVFKVVRNERYWKPGLPKVDGVTIRSVPESGSRFAMLQADEIHFDAAFSSELVPLAAKNSAIKVVVTPSIVANYAALNTMKKPFGDVRIRKALNHAVDKNAFCKAALNGYCIPADSPLPPALDFYVPAGSYPYDLAKAKALLAEAGYPKGFAVELVGYNNSASVQVMQFLQQQLAKVGVKVKVLPLESGTLTRKVWDIQNPKDVSVEMLYGVWSASTGDADWGLRPLLWSKGFPPVLYNIAYYRNAEVDAALEAAVATADPEKRAALYATVQKIVWNDAPWIFLGSSKLLSARSAKLSGVYLLPDRGFLLEEAEFAP